MVDGISIFAIFLLTKQMQFLSTGGFKLNKECHIDVLTVEMSSMIILGQSRNNETTYWLYWCLVLSSKFLGNSVVTRNRLCSAELLIYYDEYISKRFISTRWVIIPECEGQHPSSLHSQDIFRVFPLTFRWTTTNIHFMQLTGNKVMICFPSSLSGQSSCSLKI